MTTAEIGTLVVGALFTLVGGWLLHQLQLGGRRRRLRRDIREESELLAIVTSDDVRLRLEARIEVLLDEYEPPERIVAEDGPRWVERLAYFAAVAVGVLVVGTRLEWQPSSAISGVDWTLSGVALFVTYVTVDAAGTTWVYNRKLAEAIEDTVRKKVAAMSEAAEPQVPAGGD